MSHSSGVCCVRLLLQHAARSRMSDAVPSDSLRSNVACWPRPELHCLCFYMFYQTSSPQRLTSACAQSWLPLCRLFANTNELSEGIPNLLHVLQWSNCFLFFLQDSASKSGDTISSTKWYLQTISNCMPSDHVVDTLAVADCLKLWIDIKSIKWYKHIETSYIHRSISCAWRRLADFLHQQCAATLAKSHNISQAFGIWHAAKCFSPMDCAQACSKPLPNKWRPGVPTTRCCPSRSLSLSSWMDVPGSCHNVSQWMCPAMWLAGLAHHVASSLCLVLQYVEIVFPNSPTLCFLLHPQWPNTRM